MGIGSLPSRSSFEWRNMQIPQGTYQVSECKSRELRERENQQKLREINIDSPDYRWLCSGTGIWGPSRWAGILSVGEEKREFQAEKPAGAKAHKHYSSGPRSGTWSSPMKQRDRMMDRKRMMLVSGSGGRGHGDWLGSYCQGRGVGYRHLGVISFSMVILKAMRKMRRVRKCVCVSVCV